LAWRRMTGETMGGESYILAIDLGTSGAKSAVVSSGGEVVDSEFKETTLLLLPNGGAEQSPDEWWDAIMDTAKRVLGRASIPLEDVVAVNCTAQWSGTVAVGENGVHLMNAIIWMDSRGAGYIKEITGGPIKVAGYGITKLLRWLTLTGGAPEHSGKGPLAHILYVKNEHPHIYEKTSQFLEPKDYINLRLTGRAAASYDSIALHWLTDNRNITHVAYNDRLIGMVGLDGKKFPPLKRSVDILGPIKREVASELGLREGVPVVMGAPDVASAAIGSGAVRDFEAHLYIGTSSWLTCHVPFKKTDIFHNMASLPSAIPGRYFVANEQESAGACLNYLRDNILFHRDELLKEAPQEDVLTIFDRIVENVPAGSEKLIFTPWLYGERTPIENHSVRAGIFNQSLTTTREHLLRAVYEGVAYNSRWLLRYVERFIKGRLDPITMIGGGANSDVWCQIHADVLDRTVRKVKDPIQANLRGAALLASVALELLSFEQIPGLIPIANTYTPNPENRGIYDELFREFLNIYRRTKGIHARLNKT
jgi:xylulokinase